LYPVLARLRDATAITITIARSGPRTRLREPAFMQALSPQSRYFRFMSVLREVPPGMRYRFTHPDLDREVTLLRKVVKNLGPTQVIKDFVHAT
jgi:acetyltransferase